MADTVQRSSANGSAADIDAVETSEWVEAVDAVVAHDGPDRARELLTSAIERAHVLFEVGKLYQGLSGFMWRQVIIDRRFDGQFGERNGG